MVIDLRIKEHPILEFKRGPRVGIHYQGRAIDAYQGETVGAALCAAGINVFTRSLKYHRPRGMFCAVGKCSSCMMRVDGIPNIKTCVAPVKDGMRVESQNCLPSANHDIFNLIDRMGLAIQPKLYFEIFVRPRFLNSLFQRFVRSIAGMGDFPTTESEPKPPNTNERKDAEIAVIGGGPAGLTAAINAAKLGCRVTLIDENERTGGQLIKQTHMFFGSWEHYAGIRGVQIAKRLSEEIEQLKNIEVLLNTSAIGLYPGKILGLVNGDRFVKLRAKKIIVTTGAYEKTLVFENNDLPGVMGAGGVQTLMNVYGIKPGSEVLTVGSGNVGLIVSYQLLQAGVNVKCIVEAMPQVGGYFVHAAKIRRMGVPILVSHSIKRAWGKNRVEGATIVQLDEKFKEVEGTEKEIKCDLICVSAGLKPTYEFMYQEGAEMKFIPELGGYVPLRTKNMETTVDGVYIAGDSCGIEEADTAMMAGRIAGISAAMSLGHGGKEADELLERTIKELEEHRSGPTAARIREGNKKVLIGGG